MGDGGTMNEKLYASDYQCSHPDCEGQADVFWGVADPDGPPSKPYCQEHADEKTNRIYEVIGEAWMSPEG